MNLVDLTAGRDLIGVRARQRIVEVITLLIQIAAAVGHAEDLVPVAYVVVNAAQVRAVVLDGGGIGEVVVLAVRLCCCSGIIRQWHQLHVGRSDRVHRQAVVGEDIALNWVSSVIGLRSRSRGGVVELIGRSEGQQSRKVSIALGLRGDGSDSLGSRRLAAIGLIRVKEEQFVVAIEDGESRPDHRWCRQTGWCDCRPG